MICSTFKRMWANIKVFECIVTTFVMAMIYNQCRSACFWAEKTARTPDVRLAVKPRVSELIMRVNVRMSAFSGYAVSSIRVSGLQSPFLHYVKW